MRSSNPDDDIYQVSAALDLFVLVGFQQKIPLETQITIPVKDLRAVLHIQPFTFQSCTLKSLFGIKCRYPNGFIT